jgi:uncharacterized membrane protein YhhN
MPYKGWLTLFFADLLLELLAITNDWYSIRFFTKPLLIAVLGVWFLFCSAKMGTLRYLIAMALLLSWMGDVFLLMEKQSDSYFLLGLGSFLMAHIVYILFFLRVRKKESITKKWSVPLIAGIGGYSLLLFLLLLPHLAQLKIPVAAYAITISVMLIAATHALAGGGTRYWFMAGALLFVVSDSLLATARFYHSFTGSDLLIMLTYALAQFSLATGAILYLRSRTLPASGKPI